MSSASRSQSLKDVDEVKLLEARIIIARAEAQEKLDKKAAWKGSKAKAGTVAAGDAVEGADGRAIRVHWKHHTDSLLQLLEENRLWRMHFGFEKKSTGTTTVNSPDTIYRTIARRLFIGTQGSKYTEADLPRLGGSVKNKVDWLKRQFRTHKATLSETGHGLVTSGKEAEIIVGSEIANVWDVIKKDFPWYATVSRLYSGSPVISNVGVGNSTTEPDTRILQRDGHEKARESPAWAIEEDDEALPNGDEAVSSPARPSSPIHAIYQSSENDAYSLPPTPSKLHTPHKPNPSQDPTPTSTSKKRKTMNDVVSEAVTSGRNTKIRLAKERTTRSREKERLRQKGKLEIERLRLQMAQEEREARFAEAERSRQHDLLMMERQLQLQHGLPSSHRGPAPGSFITPNFDPAGPPQGDYRGAIDPRLGH